MFRNKIDVSADVVNPVGTISMFYDWQLHSCLCLIFILRIKRDDFYFPFSRERGKEKV